MQGFVRHGCEQLLRQQVTIIDNGVRTQVSAELAFLQKIAVSGLKDDSAIANDLLMSIEAMQSSRSTGLDDRIERIEVWYVNPDRPNRALELLGIAKPFYCGKPNAHMAIHPKTVEAAFERFPDRRFTREEQQIIVAATQTPDKVSWPDWWTVIPPQRR